MHTVWTILVAFLVFELFSVILYIPRLINWFDGKKPQPRLHAKTNRHFALLIPARNESVAIAPLLDSVRRQDYPETDYDVYVIVQDADDPTVSMVRSTLPDAVVQVVPDQHRKAEAMDACMQRILDSGNIPNAFLVVDADCILAPDYLTEMNNALESGADVVIPRKKIKNWLTDRKECRTLIANCSAMTYVGVDAMGNKGKGKRGYPLALCGQGMLMTARVIRGLGGYPFRSLTEDFEVAVECMRHGYKQLYYEHAILYSEEPVARHEYNKRRVRWLKGFVQFQRRYGREIRRLTFRNGKVNVGNFRFLFDLYPIYFMLGGDGVAFALLGITAIVFAVTHTAPVLIPLLAMLLPLGLVYLQLLIYAVAQLWVDGKENRMTRGEKWQFALLFPFVSIEYVWILLLAVFTTSRKLDVWEPVARLSLEPGELALDDSAPVCKKGDASA